MISETSNETNTIENHTQDNEQQKEPQQPKETRPVSKLGLQSSLLKPTQNEQGKSSLLAALQSSNSQNVPPKKSVEEAVLIKYSANWVNKKEDDKLYTIAVELPHYETVGDALNDILPLLNETLLNAGSQYVLSEDPAEYDLFKAKKNGHPKFDYPAFDAAQMLNQTGVQQISIVEKDPKSITIRQAKPKEKEIAPIVIPKQNPNDLGKSSLNSALISSSSQKIPSKKSAEETVLIKYSANWVNKKEDDKLYTVAVELPHYETVGDAINDVLPLFNESLKSVNSPYILSEDPTQYDLYKSKKNGHPKLDYPALDANQLLNQTGVQQISIVEKDPKSITLKQTQEKTPIKQQEKPQVIKKERPDSMLDTSMPDVLELSVGSLHSKEEEYEVETTCFCFKKKVLKRKKVPQNISMQQNLSTGLLDSH